MRSSISSGSCTQTTPTVYHIIQVVLKFIGTNNIRCNLLPFRCSLGSMPLLKKPMLHPIHWPSKTSFTFATFRLRSSPLWTMPYTMTPIFQSPTFWKDHFLIRLTDVNFHFLQWWNLQLCQKDNQPIHVLFMLLIAFLVSSFNKEGQFRFRFSKASINKVSSLFSITYREAKLLFLHFELSPYLVWEALSALCTSAYEKDAFSLRLWQSLN